MLTSPWEQHSSPSPAGSLHTLTPFRPSLSQSGWHFIMLGKHQLPDYITDSLAALHALCAPSCNNFQFLSFIQYHLATLHREYTTVICHWVPKHMGVAADERADAAAQITSTGPHVTFQIPCKRNIDRATLSVTHSLFTTVLEEGSRSAQWFEAATRQEPLVISPQTPSHIAAAVLRPHLGHVCGS